ncbi:MAG: DNA polymerase III subunit alpha [Mycoplasmoidaceae bacterium]
MSININTHSYYSLLESTLSIDDIISFAIQNNQKHVFLTDSNLYGSIEFYNKAIEKNLIPIIGLDIFYFNKQLIIFPTSNEGYKNLIKISSNILQKKEFDINNYSQDILIIFDGKKIDEINPDYFFTRNTNSDTDIYINEARVLKKEDQKTLQIMNAIKFDKKINDFFIEQEDKNLLTELEFKNHVSENLINHDKLLNLVVWKKEIKKAEIIKFPLNDNISSEQYLKKLCEESLIEKIEKKDIESYRNRLNYELNVINSMGFNDYFLIVHDFIREAKNRDILIGPGRGSSSGSLVSFLLDITKIDPIKYNLIFERFLNPNRNSLPDIDIDIMDKKREEIIEYIFNKYGEDHVAHIITFQRIKAKMAIRDVGRVLDIDLKIINRISKLISTDFELDIYGAINKNSELKNFYDEYKELFDSASKLISAPRQVGIHAAGILLSREKLTDVVPVQLSANNIITTQVSMEYLESLGLLKMDLLGLSNLTTIFNVLKLINKNLKMKMTLESISLEDDKVFKEISQGNTIGIFQLESPGMRSTLRKIKPRNLEDISLVSALYRPGPQKNIPTFIKGRFSNEPIDYIDDRIKDILEPTSGIIVYQEQVIQIAQRVANFSAADADIFRKVMSKKEAKKMESIKSRFIESAINNNYSKPVSEEIFNYIEKFASYGFNHCHSISYALISYWMVYLKTRYPLFFMSVLFKTSENSQDKIGIYCNEALRMNLKIEKPDINISSKSFIIVNKTIYFGFSSIKGIGTETANKIINIRNESSNKKFDSFENCVTLLFNGGIGESSLETLIYSGSFDCFGKSKKFMIDNLKEAIELSKNVDEKGNYFFEPNWIINEETEQDKEIFLNNQFNLIGFNFLKEKNNKFAEIRNSYSDQELDKIADIVNEDKVNFYTILFKIQKVELKMTKFNKEMAFIKICDEESSDSLSCFNYKAIKDKLIESNYIIAVVKSDSRYKQLVEIKEVIKNE